MGLQTKHAIFDTRNFSEWCFKCVLPCSDLIFYEQVFNGKFRIDEFVQELFSGVKYDFIDEEKFRKSIIPNAQRIVSFATANALANAANYSDK